MLNDKRRRVVHQSKMLTKCCVSVERRRVTIVDVIKRKALMST